MDKHEARRQCRGLHGNFLGAPTFFDSRIRLDLGRPGAVEQSCQQRRPKKRALSKVTRSSEPGQLLFLYFFGRQNKITVQHDKNRQRRQTPASTVRPARPPFRKNRSTGCSTSSTRTYRDERFSSVALLRLGSSRELAGYSEAAQSTGDPSVGKLLEAPVGRIGF